MILQVIVLFLVVRAGRRSAVAHSSLPEAEDSQRFILFIYFSQRF